MNDRRRKTILVVDDAEDICLIVIMMMRPRGHTVLTAKNGREALKILLGGTPVDLILLDVMMPEMGGFETLAEIRKRGLNIPVVMLTARSAAEDIIKGYQVGADYYIPKPFNNDTVLNIVDYLIGDLPEEERKKLEAQI